MNRYFFCGMIALLFGLTAISLGQSPQEKRAEEKQKSEISGDVKKLVEGNNEFAFDLFHQLGKKPGNLFFSPYSISTALGMTYAGARGNTAKEMAQTLHFTLDNERLHPAFGELIRNIQGADRKRNYQLAVANSLWGAKGLSLEPSFLRITQSDYQAGFQFEDFIKDAEGARRRINAWVEDKTNKKIQELLPLGFIDAQTRLILVNAIYFKGDWSVPFPKAATKAYDFTIPGTPAFKVPMMKHTFFAGYMENADFQLAQFQYKDNDVSMVVILPKKLDGLPEMEKALLAKTLEQALVLASKRTAELAVSLPKLKITEEFRLASEFAKMGIIEAFRPGIADFSAIGNNAKREDSLFISEVFHKAFVEVDEKGSEGAAGTGVAVAIPVSPPPAPLPPIIFTADHPFLFLVRHNATGSILFMARVYDPRAN